jgi:hypothetical protein
MAMYIWSVVEFQGDWFVMLKCTCAFGTKVKFGGEIRDLVYNWTHTWLDKWDIPIGENGSGTLSVIQTVMCGTTKKPHLATNIVDETMSKSHMTIMWCEQCLCAKEAHRSIVAQFHWYWQISISIFQHDFMSVASLNFSDFHNDVLSEVRYCINKSIALRYNAHFNKTLFLFSLNLSEISMPVNFSLEHCSFASFHSDLTGRTGCKIVWTWANLNQTWPGLYCHFKCKISTN